MSTYQEEHLNFLYSRHKMIAGQFVIDENLCAQSQDGVSKCLYRSGADGTTIVLSLRGADKGKVFFWDKGTRVVLFEELLGLVRYLELCRERGLSAELLLEHARCEAEQKRIAQEQRNDAAQTEKKEAQKQEERKEQTEAVIPDAYLRHVDRIDLTDELFAQMDLPDKIIIDGRTIEKVDIDFEVVDSVLQHIYQGDYDRIELTRMVYMERKKHRYLAYEDNLVYECENGRTFLCYFTGENMHANIFFENRDRAGSRPSDEPKTVRFRGREECEQHMICNRGRLAEYLMEFLLRGTSDCDPVAYRMERGFFSGKSFSNKNAYLKRKNQLGEFQYELF